ncbi:hypothetical protein BU15DRAFT_82095 [Melanogaster broomeanus]|nr:hypothetical protein BU15DRAFT_82095 [Melanogaster broomeanus]
MDASPFPSSSSLHNHPYPSARYPDPPGRSLARVCEKSPEQFSRELQQVTAKIKDGLGRVADHLGSVSRSLRGVCNKNLIDRVARRCATGRSSPWLEALGALTTILPRYIGGTIATTFNYTLTLFYGSYSRVYNSCFVENHLAIVENDDDVLMQHPCSVPPTSTASLRRVCNPRFTGNGLVVVENDNYVLAHPPGPAPLTSTASSRP